MFWKLLFNFKSAIAILVLWFVGRLFFRKKPAPAGPTRSSEDLEARIYRNVTKAIINGYEQARRDEESERHRGITDDSYE